MKARKLASDVSLVFHKLTYLLLVTILSLVWPSLKPQIAYKQGSEQEQGEYNYPATQTPGYQSQRKLDPLKDVSQSHKVSLF